MPSLTLSSKSSLLLFSCVFVFLLVSPCYGVTIEEQLNAVRSIAFGPFIKLGIGVATLVGTLTAIVRGAMGVALGCFCTGIALSYYLGWLNTHNFLN